MNLRNKKTLNILLVLILVIHVIFITTLWQMQYGNINIESKSNFVEDVNNETALMISRLESYNEVLYGLRGLFLASDVVNREEWDLYVNSLQTFERYPGVIALSYSQIVNSSNFTEFINELSLGYPEVNETQIRSLAMSHSLDKNLLLKFYSPFNSESSVLGYDSYASIERKTALDQAIENGVAYATKPLELVLSPGETTNYIVYLPIYRKNTDLSTIDARVKNTMGVVGISFNMGKLMEELLIKYGNTKNINVSINDITNPSENINVYFKKEIDIVDSISEEVKVDFVGRIWQIQYSADIGYKNNPIIIRNTSIFFGAILVGGIIFIIFAHNRFYRRFALKQPIFKS